MRFEIHQVNSIGFGGNNFGGEGADVETEGDGEGAAYEMYSKNVRLQDAVRNHQIYQMPGPKKENWTVSGMSWAAPAKIGSKKHRESNYTEFEVKNLEQNEWFNDREIFNSIGKNITINGFMLDMSGDTSHRRHIWADNWGSNTYKNGKIHLHPKSDVSWFRQNRFSLVTKLKNIDVVDQGGGIQMITSFSPHQFNKLFENVAIDPVDGVDPLAQPWNGGDIGTIFGFELSAPRTSVDEPTKDNLEKAMRNEFRQFEYNRTFQTRFFTFNEEANSEPYHPYDLFFVNSAFANDPEVTAAFIRFKGEETDAAARASRLYWSDVTFNTITNNGRSKAFHRHLRPGGVFRIRNSQDRSGRTSGNSGTYTSDAGDEGNDYVLIDTNLLSRPWERSATVTSGNPTVQSIEIANSDGTIRADDNERQEDPYLRVNLNSPIQSGNTIEVNWTARVTPLDDFRTTGLFVTRPVENQSFTSGEGPFTIDLRGVAASQESREKIFYTASSDDTSIVTANVQNDDFTLELTEQGTGTATVTVTGSIDGVGSTTDTFEVPIE
jgi:hypothetical protein